MLYGRYTFTSPYVVPKYGQRYEHRSCRPQPLLQESPWKCLFITASHEKRPAHCYCFSHCSANETLDDLCVVRYKAFLEPSKQLPHIRPIMASASVDPDSSPRCSHDASIPPILPNAKLAEAISRASQAHDCTERPRSISTSPIHPYTTQTNLVSRQYDAHERLLVSHTTIPLPLARRHFIQAALRTPIIPSLYPLSLVRYKSFHLGPIRPISLCLTATWESSKVVMLRWPDTSTS